MVLTLESFGSIKPSIASVSIGHGFSKTPNLADKISAASKSPFKGIELGFPDLVAFASTHHGHSVEPTDYDSLASAAEAVKKLCDDAGLEIMLLQPFANFEGWEKDSPERKDAFDRAQGWIQILTACGCKTLQVGSSDSPQDKIGTDRSRFVEDLKELADLLAEKDLKLAYENWCWSTHAPDWKDIWDIVRSVGKPNVGLCLDTFQTAGGEWADPSTKSGLIESEKLTEELVEERFKNSLLDLVTTIAPEKIFVLQVSDAYKPPTPLAEDSDGVKPRAKWSGAYRPAPYGEGYLPVVQVAKAVLKTGFRGWFSYETFDMGPEGKGKDYDLEEFVTETYSSHKRLLTDCVESGPGLTDDDKRKETNVNKEGKDKERMQKQEQQEQRKEKEKTEKKEMTDVNKETQDLSLQEKQQQKEQQAKQESKSDGTPGVDINREGIDQEEAKRQEQQEKQETKPTSGEPTAVDINREGINSNEAKRQEEHEQEQPKPSTAPEVVDLNREGVDADEAERQEVQEKFSTPPNEPLDVNKERTDQ